MGLGTAGLELMENVDTYLIRIVCSTDPEGLLRLILVVLRIRIRDWDTRENVVRLL